VIGRDTASRNDTVNVRMQKKILSPRMQDADNADLSAQMFRVRSYFQQRRGNRIEEQIVEAARVFSASTFSSCGTLKTTWK